MHRSQKFKHFHCSAGSYAHRSARCSRLITILWCIRLKSECPCHWKWIALIDSKAAHVVIQYPRLFSFLVFRRYVVEMHAIQNSIACRHTQCISMDSWVWKNSFNSRCAAVLKLHIRATTSTERCIGPIKYAFFF